MTGRDEVRFSTGCRLFDMMVGGSKGVYGIPAGKFINVIGDKSAGKSLLCTEFIANAYHTIPNFKWVYDDCESGYTFDTESMYGFDISNGGESFVNSTTVEEAFCNISDFADGLKDDECGIYILDSLDGLTSQEQDDRAEERLKAFHSDKAFDKGSYGMGKQKYLSQEFFPQLCSKIQDKNVLVIIVSQIRDNVDMFSFEKYTRSGGKAMDFYAHSVIWLATMKKITRRDRVVGTVVKAKTTKSKTPRPFRECVFSLLFDYGVDNIGTNIDYLYDLRTPQGELNTKSKSIQWDSTGGLDLQSLKAFLEDWGLVNKFESSKYFDGKYNADDVFEFIQKRKEYRELYSQSFGESMSRDELIAWVEDNDKSKELEDRVESKWESIEDEIRSHRRKKYGDVPEVRNVD